jgi:hypothetical protein
MDYSIWLPDILKLKRVLGFGPDGIVDRTREFNTQRSLASTLFLEDHITLLDVSTGSDRCATILVHTEPEPTAEQLSWITNNHFGGPLLGLGSLRLPNLLKGVESRYGSSSTQYQPSSGNGAGWKIAVAVCLTVLAIFLVVALIRPGQTGVTLDSSVVEELIIDDAASGGYEIYVDCPSLMVGDPGDTWICEGGDAWGFSGPIEVTLEDTDGWVTWEYLF